MSDNVLLDMNRMIGEIHGTLKSMERRHDETMEKLDKHEVRIVSLEQTKHTAHGVAIGLGGISGIVGTYFSHIIGIFK